MRPDELRGLLHDAAADQPPVSPTARTDVLRRARRHRMRAGGLAAVTAAVVVAAGLTLLSGSSSSTRVATNPAPTVPTPTAVAPTVPTTAAPSTTTTAAPVAGPPAGPVPADFSPASVTFVSTRTGWVLGPSCTSGSCPVALLRTTDGGNSWGRIPAPPTRYSMDSASGVRDVRFANTQDGWAFGPELWATHDGGTHWHQITVDPSPQLMVEDVEAVNGTVHAAYLTDKVHIATSAVGEDAWRTSPTSVELGAGPVPAARITLQGGSGWLIENDRTVVGGARLVGGSWQPWTPPCASAGGPATLTASTATDVVALCQEGVWSGSVLADRVYVSTDGGTTFKLGGTVPSKPSTATVVGSPSAGTMVVGGTTSDELHGALFRSSDGGGTWDMVYRGDKESAWIDLGLTTPTNGVAIVRTAGGGSKLLGTRDGGRTWDTLVG
jgi:photosystem II stability/assembly factor-like uncharacterized protein